MAFMVGLGACCKYISDGDCLNVVCDDEQSTAFNCYKLWQRMRVIQPDYKKKIVAVTFAVDEEFPPVQAADMLAYLFRCEAGRALHREYYESMPVFEHLTARTETLTWAQRHYGKEWFDYFESKWDKPHRADTATQP